MATLVEDAVQTHLAGGTEYLTRSVHALYSEGNPFPSSLVSYSIKTPINVGNQDVFSVGRNDGSRTVQFTYNYLLRPTQATYPGGAYIKYNWDSDGNYILSKEEDLPNYKTLYVWKDLVGLTDVTAPSRETTRYTYDARNRLATEWDTKGNPLYHFFYKLKNE